MLKQLRNLIAILWIFGASILSSYLSSLIINLCLPSQTLNTVIDSPIFIASFYILSDLVLLFVTIFIPYCLLRKKWSPLKSQLGFNHKPSWTDVGLVPSAYIISHLIALPLTLIFSFFPWFNADEAQDLGLTTFNSAPEILLTFIAIAIVAPIVEEIIFRGWLYNRIRQRTNLSLTILLVSLAFAIIHFQWNVGIVVFAMSIVLCLLREYTGSIHSGILVHILNNTISFYLLYLI